MRKFIVAFILLLIVCGAGFFYGWVSFFLGEEEYGVVFTRAAGWESEVLSPGEFAWRWERLVPANMTVYRFPVRPYQKETKVEGILPSGEVYASLMDKAPDFSFEIRFFLSFTVTPDSLPALARDHGLRPEDLPSWYERTAEELAQKTLFFIREKYPGTSADPDAFGTIIPELTAYLEEEIPEVKVLTVSPRIMKLPDVELYVRVRNMYFSVLDARSEALSSAEAQIATEKASETRNMEKLIEIGEVLTTYPILLQYLSLESGGTGDLIDIESIKLPPDR